MIDLRVTHRRHAYNDILNFDRRLPLTLSRITAPIRFLNRLAIQSNMYTSRTLISSKGPQMLIIRFHSVRRNIMNLNHTHDTRDYFYYYLKIASCIFKPNAKQGRFS